MKPCLSENGWQMVFLAGKLATDRLQAEQSAAQQASRYAAVRRMIQLRLRGASASQVQNIHAICSRGNRCICP